MIKALTRSNTAFLVPLQLTTTLGLICFLIWGTYSLGWLLTSLVVYFCTGCLGITVLFHRYLSHKSYKLYKPVEYLFSLFGALGGTGSTIGWVAIHRQHHLYSDQEKDPHSPKNQGWKVIFPSYEFDMNKWAVRDLVADRFHLLIHEYYFLILFVWAASVFLLFGLTGLIFIVCAPIVLQIWISVLSNYGNHKAEWGYKNFETHEDSVNVWWLALLTWGEGWHNNHHKYPGNPSFKRNWWEFDITGLIIQTIRADQISLHKKQRVLG